MRPSTAGRTAVRAPPRSRRPQLPPLRGARLGPLLEAPVPGPVERKPGLVGSSRPGPTGPTGGRGPDGQCQPRKVSRPATPSRAKGYSATAGAAAPAGKVVRDPAKALIANTAAAPRAGEGKGVGGGGGEFVTRKGLAHCRRARRVPHRLQGAATPPARTGEGACGKGGGAGGPAAARAGRRQDGAVRPTGGQRTDRLATGRSNGWAD